MIQSKDTFRHGQWAAICDRCGFRFYSSQLRREWTGLRTCSGGGTNNCFEPRHPQEFVRGRKDKQTPPWVRPEQPDSEDTPAAPDWDAL